MGVVLVPGVPYNNLLQYYHQKTTGLVSPPLVDLQGDNYSPPPPPPPPPPGNYNNTKIIFMKIIYINNLHKRTPNNVKNNTPVVFHNPSWGSIKLRHFWIQALLTSIILLIIVFQIIDINYLLIIFIKIIDINNTLIIFMKIIDLNNLQVRPPPN